MSYRPPTKSVSSGDSKNLPLKPFEFHGQSGQSPHMYPLGIGMYSQAKRPRRPTRAFPDLPPAAHRRLQGQISGMCRPKHFEQLMVTEYGPGAGIGWHRDPTRRMRYSSQCRFLAPCTLRLRSEGGGGLGSAGSAPCSSHDRCVFAPWARLREQLAAQHFAPDGRSALLRNVCVRFCPGSIEATWNSAIAAATNRPVDEAK